MSRSVLCSFPVRNDIVLRSVIIASTFMMLVVARVSAQEVEPRFYYNAPIGTNVAALVYSYSYGAVLLNKTIPVENVDGRIHGFSFAFGRFIDFFGMASRVDLFIPLAAGTWAGEVAHRDSSVTRTGFGDLVVRGAVFFLGAPAVTAQEFQDYQPRTVAGGSFRIRIPLGQYSGDRLLNLGANRWSFSPRLGIAHSFGKNWMASAYWSVWFFTDNTDAFGGVTFSQAVLSALQGHMEYTFDSGVWVAASVRQSFGGDVSVNGVRQNNPETNTRLGVTVSVPVRRSNALRLSATTGLSATAGNDYDSFYVTWVHTWGGD